MRRARFGLVVAALLVTACGSDAGGTEEDRDPVTADDGGDELTETPADGETTGDDGSTGESDGTDGALAECPREQVPPLGPYVGERPWTVSDYEACGAACAESTDPGCIEQNCADGADLFNACVNQELNVCLSAAEGACRTEWEDQVCCAVGSCDVEAADAQACVRAACADEISSFKTCGDGAYEQCMPAAVPRCLSPDDAPPAGDPADGAGGGASNNATNSLHTLLRAAQLSLPPFSSSLEGAPD